MVLTYENLLRFRDLKISSCVALNSLNRFSFLSFQDALHYLIRSHRLIGKTILVPSFYCDATINDMHKHGLRVVRCKTDHDKFDVDYEDFLKKISSESPDVVLIYYYFGKSSVLLQRRSWLNHIKPTAVLISDFAHSLLPHHRIEFLTERHLYIDSTRKTTSCMMAHLVMPSGLQVDTALVSRFSLFRYAIRILFALKSSCLRLATVTEMELFSKAGNYLYSLHDQLIGSTAEAFAGFSWDSFVYRHIDFERIRDHRLSLHKLYLANLADLSRAGHLKLFEVPAESAGTHCFFFVTISDAAKRALVLAILQKHGYWSEALWNFDVQRDIDDSEREWAKSVIVLPYSTRTLPRHVEHMALLMKSCFHGIT